MHFSNFDLLHKTVSHPFVLIFKNMFIHLDYLVFVQAKYDFKNSLHASF